MSDADAERADGAARRREEQGLRGAGRADRDARATSAPCPCSTASRSATRTSSARSSSTTARARLLVVMPNGYGIYQNGEAAAAEDKQLLAKLPPPGLDRRQRARRLGRERRARARAAARDHAPAAPAADEELVRATATGSTIVGGVILLCARRVRRAAPARSAPEGSLPMLRRRGLSRRRVARGRRGGAAAAAAAKQSRRRGVVPRLAAARPAAGAELRARTTSTARRVTLAGQRGQLGDDDVPLHLRARTSARLIAGNLNTALRKPGRARRPGCGVLSVSVDPERDTPAAARKLRARPPAAADVPLAARHASAELQQVWRAYNVAVLPGRRSTVSHSTFELLIDPTGPRAARLRRERAGRRRVARSEDARG